MNNQRKVTLLQGLPGSGKSTEAAKIVKANKNTFRINRDLLREMLYCHDFNPKFEKVVTIAEKLLADALISAGYNLVVDNMNLNEAPISLYKNLAEKYKASFEIIKIDTSVDECIRRDENRQKMGGRLEGEEEVDEKS